MHYKGLTLIELLIYIAIVSTLTTACVYLATNLISARTKNATQSKVIQTSQFLDARLRSELKLASAINSVTPNSLCLESSTPAYNPTHIYLASAQVMVGWGGGDVTCQTTTNNASLTPPDLTVTNLQFADLSLVNTKHVSYLFTIISNQTRYEYVYESTYEGSVELR